jgi:DNA-binding XRE family transcriptional regulator
MNRAQKQRFERAGWKVGTAAQLLGLTAAEEALVEAKLRLAEVVRTLRMRKHLSQAALAKLMGSSQPRVAKVENRDPEVSLDLQMKAIFAASPDARRDFNGLIKKWSKGPQRSRSALVTASEMRGRR